MIKQKLEEYQDPRWQKLRLQILERDEWMCQLCGDDTTTLHVHHRYYFQGKKAWEYPPEFLITLCSSCHEDETASMETIMDGLVMVLKRRFLSNEIIDLSSGFHYMELPCSPKVMSATLSWVLQSSAILKELVDRYFQYLAEKRKNEDGTDSLSKT